MTIEGTLSRRLSIEGCKIAGTQLATTLDELKKQKVALPADVISAAGEVVGTTEALRVPDPGATMSSIDNATDSACASLDDALEARVNAYSGEDILPLTDEQRAERELAAQLRRELLPDGTAFVHAPHRQQWARMEKLDRDLTTHAKSLQKLGLGQQTARLHAWITLYGQRLGITATAPLADTSAQAVAAWHDAWQELVDTVRGHLLRKDRASAEALLAPYEQQAASERQARRGKRKAKDEG